MYIYRLANLHRLGDVRVVEPSPGDLLKLIGVDDTEDQHGVDDDHPPERSDGQAPPAVTHL